MGNYCSSVEFHKQCFLPSHTRRVKMKILVCTDGSGQSQKAIEAAAKIACGCDDHEVAVVHVYERSKEGPYRIEGKIGRAHV